MIGYLKEELLRFIKSPTFLLTIILSMLYSVFGIWVFSNNHLPIRDLFYNFTGEYIIILLVLSFFITNHLFGDDINRGIIHFYNLKKMLVIKLVVFLLEATFVYILNYIFTLLLSIFIFDDIHLYFRVVMTFIKVMPMLIFYNQIFVIIMAVCKKNGYSFVFIYLIYSLISYLNNYLINSNITKFNNAIFMNLNFNSLRGSHIFAVWHFILLFLGLDLGIYFILKKVK